QTLPNMSVHADSSVAASFRARRTSGSSSSSLCTERLVPSQKQMERHREGNSNWGRGGAATPGRNPTRAGRPAEATNKAAHGSALSAEQLHQPCSQRRELKSPYCGHGVAAAAELAGAAAEESAASRSAVP